nr:MAG TPA: hypothetical protein [Caudoviricetes sp.]
MKFKVKQDFYDWEANVKRLVGQELELTDTRYVELVENFASNGVAVSDILEEVGGTESYNPTSYSFQYRTNPSSVCIGRAYGFKSRRSLKCL